MKRASLFAAELLLIAIVGGCKGVEGPCWLHPGSAQCQQKKALRYDPYPENETGPPMEGVRPRDYQKPPPEASRARWHLGNWGQ